jgi:hypothetical protein
MLQPRPIRDQHGDPFPHPHPEDQPRLVGERHPKEENPLPFRAGSGLSHFRKRRVPAPKHDLLHRIKRLWRFVDNERVDALEVQTALVPYTIACLGHPRLLGLAVDWT